MRQVSAYHFSGIDNFRDFGGVASLPSKSLFRSAHLSGATEEDLVALGGLNLATIIDLRRPSERLREPSPERLSGRTIASPTGDRAQSPHLEFLRQGDTSDAAVERFLLDYYRKAPFAPQHLEIFHKAFSSLKNGPILIHCTAGKDRTGLLAALILAAHGVHHDDVVEDFLATNAVMFTDRHIERASAMARALLGGEASPAVIRAILAVEQRHLEAAFNTIRAQAGSIEKYVSMLALSG